LKTKSELGAYAAIEALKAEIEGMKAENESRIRDTYALAYGADDFNYIADSLGS
jgi:hypothetical protein